MQYQEKLMNQTWENDKKPSFGPDVAQIWGAKFFSPKIWLRQLVDVVISYHHVKYQKKLMIQSWENLVTEGRTDRRTRVIS